MRGLQLFSRTNSRGRINLASWHSPHSLTWSWILGLNWHGGLAGRPFWHSDRYGFQAGFGTFLNFRRSKIGNPGWEFSVLGASLSWTTQEPMWYRDLYTRLRDEQDQISGLAWLHDKHPHKVHDGPLRKTGFDA